jgi:two-component system chemotaxis sensor kinase CheA
MDFDREALVRTFLAETDEHLQNLEQAAIALETRPQDGELLATIFRAAHTLKGNASVLELGPPGELAHVLEGLLDRLREGKTLVTSGLVTLLLESVDAMREMVPAALGGAVEMSPRHRVLVDRLAAAAAGQAVEPGPAPGPVADVLAERSGTLRVQVAKLDRMLDLTGEITVARGRLLRRVEALGPAGLDVLESLRETDGLYRGLQETVMSARMVTIGGTLRRYARMVRDLAAAGGRRVRLITVGEDVEVDTAVIEKIGDPLTHMIRNALDHGIEAPEVRAAAGKEPCGTLTLRAFHEAGSVVVEVEDDGAGLDRPRILERARERGLVRGDETPPPAEIDQLIFEPGFSTSESVTTLSGRGVGMDVVRRNVEALRGSVTIDSLRGGGTTIAIRLPLTLAVIDALAVGVGGETYLMPLGSVVECLELPAEARAGDGASGLVENRGGALSFMRLRALLDVRAAKAAREHIVVVRADGRAVGLVVDVLHGESQVVIKPLDKAVRTRPGIVGSTILGDGRVGFILDPAVLAQSLVASAGVPA